jgi:CBS domain-containing protein
MLAKSVMTTKLVTAHVGEHVHDVLLRMRENKLRMLPVLNDEKMAVGVFSTFSVLGKVLPSYILSGDLEQLSYAPDIGLLKDHFDKVADENIEDVMDDSPLVVNEHESLLSTAAALMSFGKHEYALVVDDNQSLVGVISAGDILDYLKTMVKDSEHNA